jgi:hypothetical protein
METEDLLPHSQKPTTCPYSEPDLFSPCLSFTSWRCISILFSHLLLGLPCRLFASGFPTKTLYALLFYPYVLHSPSISFSMVWSTRQCLVSSTCHLVPRNLILSTPLLPRPSYTKLSSSTPFPNTLSLRFSNCASCKLHEEDNQWLQAKPP